MKKYYSLIKTNILYYFIYLLFFIEIFISVRSKYLMGDESFTFHLLHHKFLSIINLTAQDVHPFIYYFIAKVSIYNIHNIFIQIFILRLISALPYLVLLIVGNIYIKNKFSKLSSILFMLSIISMPLFADNISQVRMYGWATLFTILFYIVFMYTYNNNNMKSFILVSVFSLLASYTHYYSLITVAIVYFIFLILFIIHKKTLKYIIISICINIILYFPWIFIIISQVKKATNSYWSDKLRISEAIHIALGITSPVYHISIFYIFPILLIIFLSIIIINKNIKKNEIFKVNIIHLFLPFVIILFGVLGSIIVHHSILIIRYIMPSMGIFWLSVSIIIGEINKNHLKIKCLITLIIILLALLSYIKVNVHNISLFNRTNSSVNIIQKLPKNSLFIYNNAPMMYNFSVYTNNNNVLKVPKADTTFSIYSKVFDNIAENKSINISHPDNYKNIFYIENADKKFQYNSKLSNDFNKKYKKKRIKSLYLSNDDKAIIYKLLLK